MRGKAIQISQGPIPKQNGMGQCSVPRLVAIPLEEVIESDIVLTAVRGRKLPRTAKLFMDWFCIQQLGN